MQMTMKEAILQGKDFEFEGTKYTTRENGVGLDLGHPSWIVANLDKLVEVEDNKGIWDKDGRAIKMPASFFFISSNGCIGDSSSVYGDDVKIYFDVGNCFKDKPSAEAHLEKLKAEQTARMEKKQ